MDVSLAWMIWSSAVEAALADAYRFAGGPVPDSGLVLGRVFFGLVLQDLVVLKLGGLGGILLILRRVVKCLCIVMSLLLFA